MGAERDQRGPGTNRSDGERASGSDPGKSTLTSRLVQRKASTPLPEPTGFVKRLPGSADELAALLAKLHENRDHIKAVTADSAAQALEFQLDWAAHKLSLDLSKDFYLPIKPGSLAEAKSLYDSLMRRDSAPTSGDAADLYGLIADHKAAPSGKGGDGAAK